MLFGVHNSGASFFELKGLGFLEVGALLLTSGFLQDGLPTKASVRSRFNKGLDAFATILLSEDPLDQACETDMFVYVRGEVELLAYKTWANIE